MFDFFDEALSGITDLFQDAAPTEIFEDVVDDSLFAPSLDTVFANSGSAISSGAEWLAKKAPSAIASGFSAMSQAGRQPQRTSSGRLGGSLSGLNMPVRSMSKASPVSALKSENWATYDSYWADRMRNFGRMNDTVSSTRVVKAAGN